MRIIFIGSSQFSERCLKSCFEISSIKIVAVITAPRIFNISYSPNGVTNVLYSDITKISKEKKIPIRTIQKGMQDSDLFSWVVNFKPDAFLIAGWYHIIPRKWLDLAPAYGLHASLLPKYSGGAPLVWAIINGETKTGITLFKMDNGVDSGPIVGQKEENIYDDDTIATLYKRIENRGIELLYEKLPQLASGNIKLLDQDDSQRIVFPQRSPEDGKINWEQSCQIVHRFIRAQTFPYPGAFTKLNEKKLHIWETKIVSSNIYNLPTGKIINSYDQKCLVICKEGALELIEISYEGITYKKNDLINFFGNINIAEFK